MQSLTYFLIFSAVLIGGFFIHSHSVLADPPPWAPAHGYREKHHKHHKHDHHEKIVVKHVYQYYPAQQVYLNPQTNQYFWLQAGNWTVGYKLPSSIQIGTTAPVTLDLETDRPYTQHSWIKQKYQVK